MLARRLALLALGLLACGGASPSTSPTTETPDAGATPGEDASAGDAGTDAAAPEGDAATGRLVPITDGYGAGGYQDTNLGAACTFSNASDGVSRCLPLNTVNDAGFADKACKVILGGAPAVPATAYLRLASGAVLKASAGEAKGVQAYFVTGGGCTPWTPGDAHLFVMDTTVDPTTFAAAH